MRRVFVTPGLGGLARVAVVLAVLGGAQGAEAQPSGSPIVIDRPVVDRAQVLSTGEAQQLSERLVHFRESERVQVAVLLLAGTDGEALEALALRTAQAWRGGDSGADSGVLVVLDTGGHRARMEVGRGLQAAVPDAEAQRILERAREPLRDGRYAAGIGLILEELFQRTRGASTAARDGSDAERWRAGEADKADHPGGVPMPGAILGVLFSALAASALVTRRSALWGWGGLVLLVLGAALIAGTLRQLPFWPAFFAPWLLGMLAGRVVGYVATEERLTALLLFVSAAVPAPLALLNYKSITHWQPPWTLEDVLLITCVELLVLALATWVVAAVLLLVLALVTAVPVYLAARVLPALAPTRDALLRWFGDRLGIVMGIFGIISDASGPADDDPRELILRASRTARTGQSGSKSADYRGGGGNFDGGGGSGDF